MQKDIIIAIHYQNFIKKEIISKLDSFVIESEFNSLNRFFAR
jgi:hypothetical protein